MSEIEPTAPAGRGRLAAAGIVRMIVALTILSALLFGSAGTMDWPRGWLFIGLLGRAVLASGGDTVGLLNGGGAAQLGKQADAVFAS